MNEERRNLQHAMTSFAYFGGLLVDPNPQPRRTPLMTLESGRPVSEAHVLGISHAYELELAGVADLLELEEILSLSDRILVMFEGRIVGEFPPGVSEEELGVAMTGGGRKAAA